MTPLPSIFAFGDPHLPEKVQVSKFGYNGEYFNELAGFLAGVQPEVLLVAGDLTWLGSINDAVNEMWRIRALAGKRKYFIEGNHDPWFDNLAPGFERCQERAWELFSSPDFYYIGGRADIFSLPTSDDGSSTSDECIGICGTRGFMMDQADHSQDEFELMSIQRDNMRKALDMLEEKSVEHGTVANLCLLHYPPTHQFFAGQGEQEYELFRIIREYKIVGTVIFGHVHSNDIPIYKQLYSVHLFCVPCELLDFRASRIALHYLGRSKSKGTG